MNKKDYDKLVKKATPPSKKTRDFLFAFLIGGSICTIGQLLRELLLYLGFNEEKVGMTVSAALITLAAVLTGFKLFEKIAKHAGAGWSEDVYNCGPCDCVRNCGFCCLWNYLLDNDIILTKKA